MGNVTGITMMTTAGLTANRAQAVNTAMEEIVCVPQEKMSVVINV